LAIILTVSELEQPIASVPVTVYIVVTVGVTTSDAVIAPVLHEYVLAPTAVKVAECPTQTALDDFVTVSVGKALTVKLIVSVLTHPFTSVPVTVYIVVMVGLSINDAEEEPVFQM
jgi:hypothetical protein